MREFLAIMPLAALGPTTSTAGDAGIAAPAAAPAPGPVAAPGVAGAPATAAPGAPMGDTVATSQGAGSPPAEAVAKQSSTPAFMQILLIVGMFVVLYFVMFRGQRKTEKSRKALVSQMKKGDKVMTIGGLVARVVSIDEDDVVLKIDESANVKAVYKKTSIQQVLDREDKSK